MPMRGRTSRSRRMVRVFRPFDHSSQRGRGRPWSAARSSVRRSACPVAARLPSAATSTEVANAMRRTSRARHDPGGVLPRVLPIGRASHVFAGSELSKAAARTGGAWRIGLEGAHARDSLLPPGMHINAVSRDLKYLAVRKYGDSAGVYLVSADGKRQKFLQTRGGWPSFSPDNQWIAFVGPDGMRISAVLDGASQIVGPVSADEPTWSPRGDELYYRNADRWMVLSVSGSNGTLIVGTPRLLFSGPFLNVRAKSYDIGPDGRFLLLLGPPEQTIGQLDVVTDFFTELRRLSPVGTQKAGR